jgi:hypothetical protein
MVTGIKGTVARGLHIRFFFSSKVHTSGPDSYPQFFLNLVTNLWSYLNLSLTPRCIMHWGVKSLCCIMQRGVKSRRYMMQWGVKSMIFAEISPLHHATVKSYCHIMHRGVKSYHCKMQRGVKGKI